VIEELRLLGNAYFNHRQQIREDRGLQHLVLRALINVRTAA
jgi:hypothetical protein